jgi:hypothetical protein
MWQLYAAIAAIAACFDDQWAQIRGILQVTPIDLMLQMRTMRIGIAAIAAFNAT